MKRICFAITCVLVICGQCASAQELSCDPRAFKNYDSSSMTEEYKLAFLKSIDKELFEELKRDINMRGEFSYLGIGGAGSNSYETFSKKRDRYLEYRKYKVDIKKSRNYVKNSFDGPGSAAYNKCIEALVELNRQRGLFMYIDRTTKETVTVDIRWNPTEGTGIKTLDPFNPRHVNLIGISPSELNKLETAWPAGHRQKLILTRDPSKDLELAINLGGDSASISVPAIPVIGPECNGNNLLSTAPSVTATASKHKENAGNVINGNRNDSWSSRIIPTPKENQWVEIDLGSPITVRRLVLVVSQDPTGKTRHVVTGVRSDNEKVELGILKGTTSSGQELKLLVPENKGSDIQLIRVETTTSPSWVAWREIEVYGCPY